MNDKIEPAVSASSPDAITFAWGQNIASRYSPSQPGAMLGNVVLAGLRRRRTREDAVELPRYPVIVICPDHLHLYDQAALLSAAKAGEPTQPLHSLPRDAVEIEVQRGLVWKRVDLLDRAGGRSYTIFLNALSSKRVGEVVRLLRGGVAPARAEATLTG